MKFSSRQLMCIAIALACLFVLASSAMGQCSMCRTALAGSNNALFIRNFNLGVLVLLIPPVTIFCSIFIVLRRHNASHQSTVDSRESSVRNASTGERDDRQKDLSE